MQKNRKRADASTSSAVHAHRRSTVSIPEVVTIDVLNLMLDEDLISRLRALDEDRNKVIEERGETRPWDEEIAYVRREQQLRRTRREAHMEFLRQEQEAFEKLEASLPVADLDNSAFVYAATGGRAPRWS